VYSDAQAAALYEVLNPWDPALAEVRFCTRQVLAADAVLDIGCGTGGLLHRARELGHRGRLVGLDPDPAMLDRARSRDDIDWIEARAADAAWEAEFDLVTMTGNAFQCLTTDGELRDSLAAIRAALRPGGRFVFGTRHPQAREWESWTPAHAFDVVDAAGRPLRMSYDVEAVADGIVTLTETTAERDGTILRADRADLRFLDVPALAAFLAGAGLVVEEQFGSWELDPVTPASSEIVTIARR
jgi:SAM-dependent methyltransferase